MDITQVKVVLIDNNDSFTYNLVDELRVMGVELKVFRNAVPTNTIIEQLQAYQLTGPAMLLLSPGPGAPKDAGNMPEVLNQVKGRFPVLGICLGHQAIVEAYGGSVGRAEDVMHGKASLMQHAFPGIFEGLSNPLSIARYHSLIATNVPQCLHVIAGINKLPMAILHEADNMLGFQFHPESILTCDGSRLLRQAITYLSSRAFASANSAPQEVTGAQTGKTLSAKDKQ
ncbi:aminodeoxychorismate/anthranilate synthase component II [Glaciecola siphonariae]|uniref:anthranilate synthase n=1 Tax=Glaciecola siphonariae TaxID=521012 RepID=A0ABV9LTN0_9ALTE